MLTSLLSSRCILQIMSLLQLATCWVNIIQNRQQYHHYTNVISNIMSVRNTQLQMADDKSLFDQLQKTFGEKEDLFAEAEKEKILMQGLRDMDIDPNLRVNNKLVEWLDSNGVWVKTQSAWGKAPHPLVISSKTEDDGESCGRGLLARESLSEGELLMIIPFELCLTRIAAQEILGKAIIPDYMDEYIAIALLLMTEKIKGTASKWKPYLDVLPTTQDVYPSFIWSDEELDMLKGSPCYFASLSLRKKIQREYEEVKSFTFARNSDQFPVDKYTFELFQWAFVMLFSRAARLTSKIAGEELALVPYADLMNHNPYSNTYIDAQTKGMPLISRSEEVALYTDRSYKKFEQVFINYGEKGNADLLLLYGFSLDRNPFNAVDISVGVSKQDPLYSSKMALIEKQGRGATSVRFPLQGERYPSELVDFLRLLLVEPEDLGMQPLQSVDFNEPLSLSLERRVLTTIISICESYIDQYPTTLDEDEKLMGDRNLFSLLTRQQRMAVKLRSSEKRILARTMTAVDEELQKIPSIMRTSSEKIPAAGRSFDTLKNKVTTDNARSVTDWVDIRTTPVTKTDADSASGTGGGNSVAERRRRRQGK